MSKGKKVKSMDNNSDSKSSKSVPEELLNFRSLYNDEQLHQLFGRGLITFSDMTEEPTPILWVGDSTIATCGNFSASTGKAKSKKTFNISAIVAAALTNKKVLKYKAQLPAEKRRVIYFDTEQSSHHCRLVLNRIAKLSGVQDEKELDNLSFVALRECNPKTRIGVIDYALRTNPDCGLVIIDGLRDLVYDINDARESTEVMSFLMTWTSLYNIHIHCVLHLNKNDSKTRGHLGTELENKAETILMVNRCRHNSSVSEVSPMHMRDKEFGPFLFQIDSNALPVLKCEDTKPISVSEKPKPLTDLPVSIHKKILSELFSTQQKSYKELTTNMQHIYKMHGYCHGMNNIKTFLSVLCSNNIIEKLPSNKGYTYHPDFTEIVYT